MRYGDDFIIFGKFRLQTIKYQIYATRYLSEHLSLKVHYKNNVIVRSKHGLKFLGHKIFASGFVMSNKSYNLVYKQLNMINSSSYLGVPLSKKQKMLLEFEIRKLL